MSTIDYNDNNTEDIIENYSQPNNISYPTYPMYYCPLCRYSTPMRDEYDDPDEYYDLDEYDDPGYRQRRRRRRRRRRRHPRFHHPYFYPLPFFFPFERYYDYWD